MRDQSFGPEAAALAVTEALRPLGTPERAAGSKEYLKSDLEFFGATVPDMRLSGEHLATVEELIRGSFTWALVDGLACNVAGAIALRDPGASWRRIDTWACDGNFWVRRSALLTLLPGIRCGKPDLTRFTRYAESMLAEKEFFIRKAIGWVLREIARRDPEFTMEWTENHIFEMSGVTFREAVRRLPVSEAERLTSPRGR